MSRKFHSDRLYKVLKIAILIVSIPLLLYAIYWSLKYEGYAHQMYLEYGKCADMLPAEECAKIWFDDTLSPLQTTLWFSWVLGLGLPILFFGGKKLLDYVYPKKNPINLH